MNKHLKRVIVGSLVIGAGVTGGLWVFYAHYYIPHFSTVQADVLYRSGQPDSRDLERLRNVYGVRTVVDLRRRNEQDRGEGLTLAEERAEVEELGMRFIHMPMDGDKNVDPQMVEQWLKIVEDKESQPVLIHCKQGVDRTGVLVAVYRTKVQGWAPQDALDEAVDLRMKADNKPHLRDYILACRAKR